MPFSVFVRLIIAKFKRKHIIFTNDELITLYPWLPLYHQAYKYTMPVLPPCKTGKQIISQDKIDSIIYDHVVNLIENEHDISETIGRTHEYLSELFRSYGY